MFGVCTSIWMSIFKTPICTCVYCTFIQGTACNTHTALLNILPNLQFCPLGCSIVISKARRCQKHAAHITMINGCLLEQSPFRSALPSGKWENKWKHWKKGWCKTKWSVNVLSWDTMSKFAASYVSHCAGGLCGPSMLNAQCSDHSQIGLINILSLLKA